MYNGSVNMGLDLSLNKNIHDYWAELEKCLNEPGLDKEIIKVGYEFAAEAHAGQLRVSGEPYISHSAWIAKIVAQLEIGQEAILAALLHDCVENTKVTLEDIADLFGDEVALLVGGLTEVKRQTQKVEVINSNIEIFRKFLFSSVNDVRVLIIRIIDKLHNGFTIDSLNKEQKEKFAKHIMGIYGPVAEYVGLHYFKRYLEDIAFRILYEEEAKKLEKILEEREHSEIKALALVKDALNKLLKINNINNCIVEGRIKSLYSTFIKTKRKGEDRVKDRVGVRVLAETVEDCYTILGLLHSKYRYLQDEFDDYISSPKPNGYRSIQTTLNWKDHLTVEIQIKTKEMHEFNEFGPASHIAYKLGKGIADQGKGLDWVKDLIKWQKTDNNIKNYRIHVLTDYVYVFTPKGDTIQLPANSTALDFAYRIHSDVGDHCSGIKINGKMDKIDTELKTGDIIEVLITKKMNVNKNWLDIVKTPWARERVRKATQNFKS